MDTNDEVPAKLIPKIKSVVVNLIYYLGIIWGVVLHYPIDGGDVQPSSSDVGAQQYPGLGVAELEEGCGPFRLLLLTLRR